MVNRRRFLQGAGGLFSMAALGRSGRAFAGGTEKHLIVIHARGGWDVTYGLDPKLGSANVEGPELDENSNNPEDVEAVQTFGGIPIVVNDEKRPAVSSFFTNWSDQCVLVNGIWVGSVAHDACTVRMMTGTRVETNPDMGVMAGVALGSDRPIPLMDLGGGGFAGPYAAFTGRVGAKQQLRLLLRRQTVVQGPGLAAYNYPLFVPGTTDESNIQGYLAARAARFQTARGAGERSERQMADYFESLDRQQQLLAEGDDFASTLSFGTSASLSGMSDTAVDLISSGLSHSILLEGGSGWDTHDDNSDQHAQYESLFSGLDALMDALTTAGLLDSTVVVVMSEMTRTPKRNSDGGKDHWPVTSAMVLGGGVTGGRVLGGTSDTLDSLPVDLATGELDDAGRTIGYDHFAAGVLEFVGVDPTEWLPDAEVLRGF